MEIKQMLGLPLQICLSSVTLLRRLKSPVIFLRHDVGLLKAVLNYAKL